MRVCIVGGIFGKPASYRSVVTHTAETVLAAALGERGHEVVELSHAGPFKFERCDVVHVHHLALGAVAAAAAEPPVRLAYTNHWLRHRGPRDRLAMRYVLARADAVVVLSETEARWQRSAFPGVAGRQRVIANGVDATLFRYSEPRPPHDGEPWRLLYVGQLARFKGVSYLLRALAALPDLRIELDLVFQVDDEEPALRGEAAELGLEAVRFLGPRAPTEIAELYSSAHALVLPSTDEALPAVISEALLVGRPVVATDVGAVREQVGDFGRVVEPRDPAALAAAIADVLGRYARYAAAAQAQSAAAAARYSVTAMADAHERMYAELLASGSPRRGGRLLDRGARAAVAGRARLLRRRH